MVPGKDPLFLINFADLRFLFIPYSLQPKSLIAFLSLRRCPIQTLHLFQNDVNPLFYCNEILLKLIPGFFFI